MEQQNIFPDDVGKEAEAEKKQKGRFAEVYEWVESAVMAVVVVVLLFTFVARTSVVNGKSMLETLHHGDMLVISKLMYSPQYGDIVVVTKPNSENEPLVKRVIATGGDSVDIDFKKGIVYVNGVELDEPYTNTPTNLEFDTKFPILVPEGEVFVMGDNRNGSLDSRSSGIGTVDERYILGKAYLRLLPMGDFGGIYEQE